MKVLAAVPTPPPWSGPEINGARLVAEGLGPRIELSHLRTSIGGRNETKGRATAFNLLGGAGLVVTAAVTLVRVRPSVVYLYLSQNWTGFLRDGAIIWLSRLVGARVVAHVRGANFRNFYETTSGWRRRFVRLTVERLRRVILVADRLRSQFAGLFPERDIRVLRNPVDGFDPASRHGVFRMLFIGHLSHAKGFGDLLQAADVVLAQVADAELVSAGEWVEVEKNILADERGVPLPADPLSLRQRWAELSARFPGRVRHLGVVAAEQKSAAFASAAVLVLPSYSEGLPMAVLEGMAAGLPVVVTPVGALPELLEDGVHGRIVPAGDPRALAAALLWLASDRVAADGIGARNRQYVSERFAPAVIRAQLAELLLEAAS